MARFSELGGEESRLRPSRKEGELLGGKGRKWVFMGKLKPSHPTLFFFFLLAVPHSMWDLSSRTRDGTRAPCSGSAES